MFHGWNGTRLISFQFIPSFRLLTQAPRRTREDGPKPKRAAAAKKPRSNSSTRTNTAKNDDDGCGFLYPDDIPDAVQKKIQRVIQDAKCPLHHDDNNNDTLVRAWRDDIFAQKLDLPYIPLDDIRRALDDNPNLDGADATKPPPQRRRLQQLAVEAYRQNVKVQQIMTLLDPAGKGCIVLQDLQRAVHELELDSSSNRNNNNDGEDWSETALEEMMTLFSADSNNGEEEDDASSILLTPDDLLRIAREVNL